MNNLNNNIYNINFNEMLDNISNVFNCQMNNITNINRLVAGMTNIVFSFDYNGGKYIYRHPGKGSDALVDRGRETIMQQIVDDLGIDKTLIAMDVEKGWKIAKYIEHRDFDYQNLNDMVRAVMILRKLHDAPCKVRWNFDVIRESEEIKKNISEINYGNFENFNVIKERIYKLYNFTKNDGIKKCNIHGDARDVNFLINDEEIYLIDWEYGGYGDPGFDIGSYICGGKHTIDQIDNILFVYFRHKPSDLQKRHFYAYIALTGWFYMHWTMLKEDKGQKVGVNKILWYDYANKFSEIALKMFEEE